MIDQDTLEKKEKTLRVLSNAYNLPAIPFIIEEVNKVIDNPMASAAHLGEVISRDQGLVTKILSVANSPLYGIPRRVSTIDFAIIILGFNHIKNIVVAFSLMDAISNFDSRLFDQKKYWLHSIITATASKRVAEDLGIHVSGEAFTAGLLHDLGIPIICKYFPKEYNLIINKTIEEGKTFLAAEQEVLGMDHQEIGKILIDRWNLPPSLSEVVGNHHNPSNAKEHRTLTSLVHLADYMTDKLQFGEFLWDINYKEDSGILDYLNLGSHSYLESFVQSYHAIFSNQIESLNIN